MSSVMAISSCSRLANATLSQTIEIYQGPPVPANREVDGVGDGLDPKPCPPPETLVEAPFCCCRVPDVIEALVEGAGVVEAVELSTGSCPLTALFCDLLFLDPTTPPTTAAMIMAITTMAMMITPFVVA